MQTLTQTLNQDRLRSALPGTTRHGMHTWQTTRQVYAPEDQGSNTSHAGNSPQNRSC
jgi:hypothetical protein